MPSVEALDGLLHHVRRLEIDAVEGDGHLEDLLPVAHVDGALDAHRAREGPGEPAPPLVLHRREDAAELHGADPPGIPDVGPHGLVPEVRGQHPPRREHGGDPRDHDPSDLEPAGHVGDVEPGRPPEGEEGEAPRVHAPAHGHDADPFRHDRVDDAVDAVCGQDALGAEGLGDPVHRPLGGGPVEPRPPAEEVAGIEVAEDEVRVGDGHRRAPLPVAGRTRIGARALRPDAEDPARVDARDRAAPGPDRHDVQARERDLLAGHPAVAREVSLAPLDQRDVGARPAHVEGDEVPLAEEARRVAAARHPAGRSRQHGAGGQADGVDDRRDPAVRLDDEDGARVARADQSLAEAREVPRERGAHVGVDDGRADPLVLLDLREHLGRQRDVGPRQGLPEPRLRRPLVAAIPVGVEVADGDRLHARPPETLDGGAERPDGERSLDRPSGRRRSRTPSRRARGTSGSGAGMRRL